MLEELIVTNLGLIEAASIEPSAGLVVVTGETGTGKTLLLGALGLAAGDTARRDVVGPHGDEAEVQARFSIGGAEQVVVRRVSRQGRSKAYLNGTMATARELTEAAAAAVEIVGQHDHLRLVSGRHVRQVIDGSFDAAAATASNEYRQAYDAWQTLVAQAGALGGDRHGLERELEMVRFQADEIAAAALAAGEEDELAAAANARRNAAAVGSRKRRQPRVPGPQ